MATRRKRTTSPPAMDTLPFESAEQDNFSYLENELEGEEDTLSEFTGTAPEYLPLAEETIKEETTEDKVFETLLDKPTVLAENHKDEKLPTMKTTKEPSAPIKKVAKKERPPALPQRMHPRNTPKFS